MQKSAHSTVAKIFKSNGPWGGRPHYRRCQSNIAPQAFDATAVAPMKSETPMSRHTRPQLKFCRLYLYSLSLSFFFFFRFPFLLFFPTPAREFLG